jgi:hypothetical protein
MMDDKSQLYFKKQHKKDVIWQIWFPVGFGALAMLALGLLAIFSLQTGADASARWGHVATIWLLLPVFVVGMVIFMLLAALVFGVTKLTAILPKYSAIAQMYARLLTARVINLADRSARPIIETKSVTAAVKRSWLAVRYLIMGGYSKEK